jgi:hypothetical protein
METFYPRKAIVIMEDPVGGTPYGEQYSEEYNKYWTLNYAQGVVYLARKIIEAELFNLKRLHTGEKMKYMSQYRKDLRKALTEHYKK